MRTIILISLFLIGCGKPLIPNQITIDAPENIEVTHRIEFQIEFAKEYCDIVSATNEDLNNCLNDFLRDIVNR